MRTSVSVLLAVFLLDACKAAAPDQPADGGSAIQPTDAGALPATPDAGSAHGILRVQISPVSALLTTIGQTRALTARAIDAQGADVAVPVAWSSSSSDDVAVDAAGQLTAMRIGSAQIFAEAEGVRSAPALIVVAEPAPGAVLVTDSQVVSVEPPVLAEGEVPGVGTQYDVRLTGVAPAPQPGTVILASETAPVAGRVVSARDDGGVLVVTLALASLPDVFSAYHLDLSIDLAPYEVTAVAPATALAKVPADESPIKPFEALGCTGSLAASIFTKMITLGIENELKLVIKDDKDAGNPPKYSKLALTGSLALSGKVEVGLNATLAATGTCIAQAQLKLPVFGWLSVLVMPGVRLGAGVELAAKIQIAKATLGVTGKLGLSPEFGWECGPAPIACHGLTKVEPLVDVKPEVVVPSTTQMQVDVSGQFFALVGLDLVFLEGLGGSFAIADAKIGPKQSGKSLAMESDQAFEAATRSSYDLVLLATLEPGSGLKAAIKKIIDDDAVGVSLKSELSVPLSDSPKGTFTVDKTRAALGSIVKLTVDLDPTTVNYIGLDYNVDSIRFRRLRDGDTTYDEVPELTIPITASNQTHFEKSWMVTERDIGKNDIAAFVRTTLPILPDLEIAEDSRKQVEVLAICAGSGGAFAASSSSGDRATLPAAGCGGTVKHTRTDLDGTRTVIATAQIDLVKDDDASAPTVWLLRPVGTFTYEENATIGDCSVTVAQVSGTWTPQPPFGPGPGAVMLYVDSEPYHYEGQIFVEEGNADLLYVDEVWACPEGTTIQHTYVDGFRVFKVTIDQNLDAGPDGKTPAGQLPAHRRGGRAEQHGHLRVGSASRLRTSLRGAAARPGPSGILCAARERVRQDEVSGPDPVHHRERGLRALQLLRDAQHPDAVPRDGAPARYLPKAARRARAKDVFHTFVIGVYFFPLLGGWLADRYFGKYHTILWFSLIYCVGQGCLALFADEPNGFYAGLFLIALGSGGIKPLRRVVRGDQFDSAHQAPREGRVRRLLLDHQLRLVLRVAADADLPARARPARRVRHPRRADVHRDGRILGRARALRDGARRAPPIPHSFLRVVATALLANELGRAAARARALAVLGVVLALGSLALIPCIELVPVAVPRARRHDRARRRRHVDAARSRARPRIPTRRSTACARCCACSSCSRSSRRSGRCSIRRRSTWVLQANDMTQAVVVRAVADAGAQPGARDAAHPVQQPRALSRRCAAAAGSRRRCAA